MNGERTFGKVMSDKDLNDYIVALVNVWWKKWRRKVVDEESFDLAMKEWWQVVEPGIEFPVAKHLGIALLYELDARLHGGYTETTRDKLLTLIRQEAPQ